jgi:gamma-glutamylcyclotransferase (GGCT)/AIG2-like uncharacterized protein YtfP
MHVFAYGTLLEPAVMRAVTGRRFGSQPAVLCSYARFRVRGAVYPGIIATPGALTEGAVYCDVDAVSLARLDTFEGALYDRVGLNVDVETGRRAAGPMRAEVYVIRPSQRQRLSAEAWDPEEFRRRRLGAYLAGVRDRAQA